MSQARASCKIVIRGSFDVSWVDYVGEMLVDVEVKEGKIRTTTLFGQPIRPPSGTSTCSSIWASR
jgi:hypothetical protein